MSGEPASMPTVELIKVILRRDLKLGDDAAIADDMPLAGGEFEIDSLDLLLLVTSIEKEFGIKIPNDAISRATFSDVAALAAFVDARRLAAGA